MSKIVWQPDAARRKGTQMQAFLQAQGFGAADPAEAYAQAHAWSVQQPEAFWQAVWDLGEVRSSQAATQVLQKGERFYQARWFSGARLNFAENLLRRRDDKTALIGLTEHAPRREISYAELYQQVERLAAALRAAGVVEGDRVAGFMPNIPETVIAMLAASSIGAVWSSCSPDFGLSGVMDRFGQIEPKVLFCADGYVYGGKRCDSLERAEQIMQRIPAIERLVVVPLLEAAPEVGSIDKACTLRDFLDSAPAAALDFAQLPFDHPLYIMYSSGTTGVPKCIVHGAGGTLLQHIKEHRLHTDVSAEDVVFYYTTCGWMMWNWLVSALACEATVVLYDGSPFADKGKLLIDAIDQEKISVFGTSAKFIAALEKTGLKPAQSHQLSSLRSILSTGSPLSDASFDYVYRDFKADVCLSSISGGTDIISCFVLGNPLLPVRRGEIQCRGLGMAVEFVDDEGQALIGEKGELVCTQPFPSCPVGFWKDPEQARFEAAYFAQHPGLWAHGDYGELRPEGGVVIHGRSDAVLNPGGVRIGTAEIYRQVETIDAIVDSVVIGQDWEDDVRVVLFVVLRRGLQLDEALEAQIRATIRANTTPRHVPAKILAVPEIPRTISGKVVELAVRNVVHGQPVKNTTALANPEALEHFRDRPELQP